MSRPGLVSLVGAGPGDPDLITRRGLDRLRRADVVVYDRLIDPRILEETPPTAERVFAGKARGLAILDQRTIERVMIDRALSGKRVVRLKGGDPFLFGRGGEEIEALAAAGVPCEVVPGVTSAIAVPAAAGIPVTHRELSSTLTIVTGHEDPSKGGETVNWDQLGRCPGTLVVLMGLERLESICSRLIAAGRAGDTPAAVISRGTWSQQRTIVGTLETLPDIVAAAPPPSPALIVVGDVVRFPEIVAAAGIASLAAAV